MDHQPLLKEQDLTKNTKSYWKIFLVGAAVITTVVVCCSGAQDQTHTENFMQDEQDNQIQPADPLDLNTMNDVQQYYKVAKKVVAVAEKLSEFEEFAALAPMLAAFGPQMALVGGLIALGVELFGDKPPTHDQIVVKKLDTIIADIHKLSKQMLNEYHGLKTEASYNACWASMDEPKNYILTAIKTIEIAEPKNKKLAALQNSRQCQQMTRTLMENLVGGQCNYFELVKSGNSGKNIWPNNPNFMKNQYTTQLLLINQGMMCTASYQVAYMQSQGQWKTNTSAHIAKWSESLGFFPEIKKIGKVAGDNMKAALASCIDQSSIQTSMDKINSQYTYGDNWWPKLYDELVSNRPFIGFVILASPRVSSDPSYFSCARGYNWNSRPGDGNNFDMWVMAVPIKENADWVYDANIVTVASEVSAHDMYYYWDYYGVTEEHHACSLYRTAVKAAKNWTWPLDGVMETANANTRVMQMYGHYQNSGPYGSATAKYGIGQGNALTGVVQIQYAGNHDVPQVFYFEGPQTTPGLAC